MHDGSCCFEVNEHYLGERDCHQSLATSIIWMHSVSWRSSVSSTSVYSDQVYSDQVYSDQVYSDQVYSDQVYSDQVYSDQVYSDQCVGSDNKTRFTFSVL